MTGPMLPQGQRHVRKAKVVIEDDAFIGQFTTVMPGTRIGRGAIVGPNSLVFGRVRPWTIVMGSPARKVGERDPLSVPDPD